MLAEALGMTVAELQIRISNQEFVQWQAFYTWRESEREKEMRKAERG